MENINNVFSHWKKTTNKNKSNKNDLIILYFSEAAIFQTPPHVIV